MNRIIIFILGLLIGGMYVQFRFAGNIWENKPRLELCESVNAEAIIKYETWQCEKNGWEKEMTVYCTKPN